MNAPGRSGLMRVLCALLLACALVAGCLASDEGADEGNGVSDGTGTNAPFGAVSPAVPDYDFGQVVDSMHAYHSVPSLHTEGHGLTLKGHAGLGEMLPPTTRGSITSVDVHGDYAVVAGMEGGLAFAVIDISDRANPTAVGWAPTAADGWTARFSADGNTVFYGCQMLGATGSPTANVVGTCTDPDAVHPPAVPGTPVTTAQSSNPAGVSAWDVTDKTNPTYLDFIAVGGSHNIYAQAINGTDYIFTATTAIIKFDNATKKLEHVGDVPGRHDQTVVQHPVTGDWLLFVGTAELTIWNVNDPADPQLVYEPEEGANVEWTGWHDQMVVPGLVDGRAILLLAGETGVHAGGGEVPPDVVSIVDITNPVQPVLLSKWSPPFAVTLPYASYLYSVHEMAATPTGQVSIAWYHAGVWVIDVSTRERQGGPVTLAAYQPHEEMDVTPSTFAQTPAPFVPFVWSAAWSADGYLVVPDMHTGLYVLEPEWGLHPALDGGQ